MPVVENLMISRNLWEKYGTFSYPYDPRKGRRLQCRKICCYCLNLLLHDLAHASPAERNGVPGPSHIYVLLQLFLSWFGHCEIGFIPSVPSGFFATRFPLPTTGSNHFYGELDWSQDLERARTPSLNTAYAGFRWMEKTFGKKIQSRKGKIINGVTRVMLRESHAWHFQIWMSYSCSASGPDNVKGFPVPSPLIKGLTLQPWSPIQ